MARAAKLDLRASQQELATRLAAKTSAQVEQSRLGLACAGAQWLIRLADAGEVIALPTVASVPMTRSWYLGIANIRGNLYGCIDFAGFLGHKAEPTVTGASTSRLVLFGPRVGELRAASSCTAFWDCAILPISGNPTRRPAPPLGTSCWTDAAGGLWQEIDLRRYWRGIQLSAGGLVGRGDDEEPTMCALRPATGRKTWRLA